MTRFEHIGLGKKQFHCVLLNAVGDGILLPLLDALRKIWKNGLGS
jgi:hypothetical protein